MNNIEKAKNPKQWIKTSRSSILTGSLTNCICTSCFQCFSNPRNFDSHRKWNSRKQESYCVDPSTIGQSLSDKLIWIVEQSWVEDID